MNPRSFISAMNHPSLMLLCYHFQIPWQHICKPGALRSFLPATHSLSFSVLFQRLQTNLTPPSLLCLNLLQSKGPNDSFGLSVHCLGLMLSANRDVDNATFINCLLCASCCFMHMPFTTTLWGLFRPTLSTRQLRHRVVKGPI